MDLREIGWGSVDWIQLAQDRGRWRALVNTVMTLRVLAPLSKLFSNVISVLYFAAITLKNEVLGRTDSPAFLHSQLFEVLEPNLIRLNLSELTVHRPGDDPRKECGNARGSNVRYYPT
jgi:hypothetical protein